MRKKRVSSKDVAKEAGVSQATVSYVLNNNKNIKIKPETRQAVLDAVKKLNYHPSLLARAMKLNKSMTVGVITDRNVTNYNFMRMLEGIKDQLQEFNYAITLLFNKSEETFNDEILEYYNTNRLDGIIFALAIVSDETKEKLNKSKLPYVVVDSHATGNKAHEVGTDHLKQLTELVAAFKARGATRIAYVGPKWKFKLDPRLGAFKDAIRDNKLINHGLYLCRFNDEKIREMIYGLLDNKERPQGIVAGAPRYGFHSLKVACSLGIRMPGELYLASLGTSMYHDLCHPTMTAVELPMYDMGKEGARVLLDIMNDREAKAVTILPSKIVTRESL